jgi:HSP20 family protein
MHLIGRAMPVMGEEEDLPAGGKTARSASRLWTPPVDIVELADSYQIIVELPGLAMEDLSISLEKNALVIKGERRYEPGDSQKRYARLEREYGPFQRQFELPGNIRADGIKAALKNGLLTLTLPKAEEARSRRIQIQVE